MHIEWDSWHISPPSLAVVWSCKRRHFLWEDVLPYFQGLNEFVNDDTGDDTDDDGDGDAESTEKCSEMGPTGFTLDVVTMSNGTWLV